MPEGLSTAPKRQHQVRSANQLLEHNGWGRADVAPMSFGDYAKAGNVSNVSGGMQSGKGVAQVVPNYGVGNETWRYG
ncbi:hypothetical protein LTR28_007781 [Elasticomyces elasticus]|nr:hypothetical protein LTR28_007781 [Elasticomyces elasticus]